MAKESSEVRVYGDGGVYLAEVGTAFPTNATTTISSADWGHLGYITNAGVKPKFGRDEKEIEAWQSLDPIRSLIQKVPKSVAFTLMQTNRRTVIAALGGGTVTESAPASGLFQYDPPDDDENKEWAMIVEATDGDYTTRLCYRRVKQTKEIEFSFVKDDATMFDIEMKVLTAASGAKPYFIQTNVPDFGDSGLAS